MSLLSIKPNSPNRYSLYLLDAHYCFLLECLVAVTIFFLLHNNYSFPIQIVASWDGFALTGIILTWITIFTQDPYEIRRRTRLKESMRTFLFCIVLFAAMASLLATWLLFTSEKSSPLPKFNGTIFLGIATVTLSWFLVHTRFAIHYAYSYYYGAPQLERHEVTGGLIFPGKEHPDYLDFAYFSFVVGMTCQVSDVQIARRPLRRLALLHGLISFSFNTAILALMVNIVAGLL